MEVCPVNTFSTEKKKETEGARIIKNNEQSKKIGLNKKPRISNEGAFLSHATCTKKGGVEKLGIAVRKCSTGACTHVCRRYVYVHHSKFLYVKRFRFSFFPF